MIRRPPRSTRTDTRFPYTTRFRSDRGLLPHLPAHRLRPARLSPGGPADDRRSGCAKRGALWLRLSLILAEHGRQIVGGHFHHPVERKPVPAGKRDDILQVAQATFGVALPELGVDRLVAGRSEERRVGKEGVRPGRSRWSA